MQWLGAVLHLSNELGKFSQWLCHDDSTANIDNILLLLLLLENTRQNCSGRRDDRSHPV